MRERRLVPGMTAGMAGAVAITLLLVLSPLARGTTFSGSWAAPTTSTQTTYSVSCPHPSDEFQNSFFNPVANPGTPVTYSGQVLTWQDGDGGNGSSCGGYAGVVTDIQFQTSTYSHGATWGWVNTTWSWNTWTKGLACYTMGATNSYGYAFAVAQIGVEISQSGGGVTPAIAYNAWSQSLNYNNSNGVPLPYSCSNPSPPSGYWNVYESAQHTISIHYQYPSSGTYSVITYAQTNTFGWLTTGDGNLFACADSNMVVNNGCYGQTNSNAGWTLVAVSET
jgi:hypothetical protein